MLTALIAFTLVLPQWTMTSTLRGAVRHYTTAVTFLKPLSAWIVQSPLIAKT
jgi:hypothetical protein